MANVNPYKEEIIERIKELIREGKARDYIMDKIINEEFKGLIFDSIYDRYRGVVAYVRVYEGSLKKGSRIKFFAHNTHYDVDEVGHFVIERKKAYSIKNNKSL